MHHRHRTHRAAAAAAAGILAALLASAAGGGAFAAPPTYTDPSASPSPSVSEPSPSTSPSADPSQSPSPDPTESPKPSYDMSITGGSAEGRLGEIVTVTFKVRTAGESKYELVVPLVHGGAQYLGDCPNGGEPRGWCFVPFNADGPVDTHTFRFKILKRGTVRVPVVVSPETGTDPDNGNNTAHATITGGGAPLPYDMSLSATSAKGRVGDVVTINLKIVTTGVPHYILSVPREVSDPGYYGVKYLGPCDEEHNGRCSIYLKRTGEVDTYALKFKITAVGRARVALNVFPDEIRDPYEYNNGADPVIEGLPANGGGGGDGGGGDDDGDLPTTGAPIAAVAAGGAALLATGVVLFVAARRRRHATASPTTD